MTDAPKPDDPQMLAAEYALGLLNADEQANAARRLDTDRTFRELVTVWETDFASLTDPLPDVAPAPAVKAAVMQTLFPAEKPAPFWRRLWLWQTVSALCVAALIGFTTLGPVGDDPVTGPLYTAEITAEAGDFRVIAVVDKSANEVILTRTLGAAPDGRILQVWAHGPGEPAMSVGLWPEGDTTRLALPPTIAAVQGVLTLGISEEPPGGSPTGSPSGRVFGTVDIPNVTEAL